MVVEAPDDDDDDESEDDEDEAMHDSDDASITTDTITSRGSNSSVGDMPSSPKPTKAETRATKRAAKAARSQSKACKNRKKHVINVRSEDVSFVAEVLHGDSRDNGNGNRDRNRDGAADDVEPHPIAWDKTFEDVINGNLGFMSSMKEHRKQLLRSTQQQRKASARGRKRRVSERHGDDADDEDDETETLLAAALMKLGVNVNGKHHQNPGGAGHADGRKGTKKAITTAQASILASLKALIRDDLERFENQQKETCVRAGGFWRYAGRAIFDRMTAIARTVDWQTGAKLKQKQKDE